METSRACTKCGVVKPLTDFSPSKTEHKDGHTLRCKSCIAEYWRERRRNNEDVRKSHSESNTRSQQKMKIEFPELVKERDRKRGKEFRANNPDTIRKYNQNARARRLNSEGSHTKEEWNALLLEFNNRCLACGRTAEQTEEGILEKDHILALTRGGSSYISNLQPLCKTCNSRKGNRVYVDYRQPFVAMAT